VTDLPLDRVVVTGAFDRPEPVEALFRRLLAEGKVVHLCGDIDYQGKPRGAPELRRAEDGLLIPRKAMVEYEVDGETFLFSFDKLSRGETALKVQGPATHLALMESYVEGTTGGARASVFRRGLPGPVLARVYAALGSPHPDGGRLKLDEAGRFIPEKLKAEVMVEGRAVTAEFAVHNNQHDLILHCEPQHLPQVAASLQKLVRQAKARRPGQVQSLRWEVDVSGYTWSRVGGLAEVAQQLRDWIELPLKNPEAFDRLGLRPPKGVLLCGPPGTGKTTLAKILACESQAAFFSISPGDIASSWYGQTEKNVRRIFARARQHGRAILFVDEIDGFFRSREADLNEPTRRALAQIMTEMDGLVDTRGVVVVGATNRAEDLDSALRRPGRFDHHVQLGLPGEAARREILAIHLQGKPFAGELTALAARSEGMSGADLELWCNTATYRAWKREAAARGVAPETMGAEEVAAVRVKMPTSTDLPRPRQL